MYRLALVMLPLCNHESLTVTAFLVPKLRLAATAVSYLQTNNPENKQNEQYEVLESFIISH